MILKINQQLIGKVILRIFTTSDLYPLSVPVVFLEDRLVCANASRSHGSEVSSGDRGGGGAGVKTKFFCPVHVNNKTIIIGP